MFLASNTLIMSNNVVQKQLERTPANFLTDLAIRCEKDNVDRTRELTHLKDFLAKKGLINATKTRLDINKCQLQPVWTGTFDVVDDKDFSTPSIGWDCHPLECHLEADLVVQNIKNRLL